MEASNIPWNPIALTPRCHEDFYLRDSRRGGRTISVGGGAAGNLTMSGLVSFLLFGALFFFMMRFGCGAHAGHGGHGDHSPRRDGEGDPVGSASSQQVLDAGVDPVCGMKVEPGTGYASVHRRKTLRFCSRGCLDKFEAQPERYLGAGAMREEMPGTPGKGSAP